MTSDLQEVFAAAANGAPAADGLAERVLHAGRRARRRRRRVLGAVGAAALALSGTAYVGHATLGAGDAVYLALAADGTVTIAQPQCRAGGLFAARIDTGAVPVGQRLRSTDPRYELYDEFANREDDCTSHAPVPLALAATTPGGAVQRALTVSGPLPAAFDLQGRRVTVRGVKGEVAVGAAPDPAEATGLTWTDPDDRSWYVLASGYSAAELVRAVDALDITAGTVRLPGTDMTDYGSSPARPAGSSVDWYASFRTSRGVQFEARTYPSTRTLLGDFTGPRGNSRLVTVNGHDAIVTSNGVGLGDALQMLTFQLQPGLWAAVSAVDVQPDDLVAFAATLVPTAQQRPGA